MKTIILLLAFFSCYICLGATLNKSDQIFKGSILVGVKSTGSTATASAAVEIVSTTKGFLPPRMTTTQRDAISNPATGLALYNSTTDEINYYNSVSWLSVAPKTMTTNGDILYYNSGYQRLAKGNDDDVLTLASGIPSWAASSGGGGNSTIEVTQAAHGLLVLTPVFFNATSGDWEEAKADDNETLSTHLIVEVADVNTFTVAQLGRYTVTGHGKTVDTTYFTSISSAGATVAAEPSSGYSNPVFFVVDANTIDAYTGYRPNLKGDALYDIQYDLTVTGTNWTTTRAVGVPYPVSLAGGGTAWRFKFNIWGSVSTPATNITLTITGITFKNGPNQAVAVLHNELGEAVHLGNAQSNASTIFLAASGAVDNFGCSGDVELNAEPSL